MEPLDLTAGPPRSPRAELDGLMFLPRTIDKARACLPGGNCGAYKMEGLSDRLFAQIGIAQADFADTAFIRGVELAADDAGVAAWLRRVADPSRYPAWNEYLLAFPLVGTGDRDEAIRRYPWLVERPDITRQVDVLVDVLEEDDRRLFEPA